MPVVSSVVAPLLYKANRYIDVRFGSHAVEVPQPVTGSSQFKFLLEI